MTVTNVLSGDLQSRLVDMGVIPGQVVRLLFKAPFGNPLAIEVGDYVLSLRKEEAALVEVAIEGGQNF